MTQPCLKNITKTVWKIEFCIGRALPNVAKGADLLQGYWKVSRRRELLVWIYQQGKEVSLVSHCIDASHW